jgi:uncharacterized protein YecE (DUF72 family)
MIVNVAESEISSLGTRRPEQLLDVFRRVDPPCFRCFLEIASVARILVGTSGWSYQSWRGPFFPVQLPAKHHLEFYSSQFETVELNGVFYRMPTPAAVERWRDLTGPGFVFGWKASKFITHWKRLSQNSINSLKLIEERLSILNEKAGPVLFQLPPQFEADAERLARS